MTKFEGFIAAIASIVSIEILIAILLAFQTAPPGAQELQACVALQSGVGEEKYRELVTSVQAVKDMCERFQLHAK